MDVSVVAMTILSAHAQALRELERLSAAYQALTGRPISEDSTRSSEPEAVRVEPASSEGVPRLELDGFDPTGKSGDYIPAREIITIALESDPLREWRYADIREFWFEKTGEGRTLGSLRTAAKGLKDDGAIRINRGRIRPISPLTDADPSEPSEEVSDADNSGRPVDRNVDQAG